jgi:hypothetical protein
MAANKNGRAVHTLCTSFICYFIGHFDINFNFLQTEIYYYQVNYTIIETRIDIRFSLILLVIYSIKTFIVKDTDVEPKVAYRIFYDRLF